MDIMLTSYVNFRGKTKAKAKGKRETGKNKESDKG